MALVRGHILNPWHAQNYEPLQEEFEILAVGARFGLFSTSSVGLPRRHLVNLSGFQIPGFLRWLRNYVGRDFLFGLDRALQGSALVHAVDTASGFSAQCARWCARHGVPLVLTIWENIPFVHEEVPRLRLQKERVRRAGDLFLAATPRAAKTLLLEGVEPRKIRVVRPGVDLDRFRPQPPDPALKARLGVPPEATVILFAGRLVPDKGVQTLVQAFGWLVRQERLPGRDLHLVLVGAGPVRDQVLYEARHMGLEGRLHLAGGVPYDQLPALHNLADVFVLPSVPMPTWQEQYGMVLAEAMGCGRPVIGADSGSIAEVVGEAGVLVPPADPFALARELERLLAEPGLRQDLGARARAWAEEHMDRRRTAALIAEAWRELMAR